MKLDNYIRSDESVIATVDAYDDKDGYGQKGEIGVTKDRIVYVEGHDVIDISYDGVHTIEYKEPSYPKRYLYWAFFPFLLGLFGTFGGSLIPIDVSTIIPGVFFLALGLFFAISGFFYQRAELRLQTPSKEYEFATKDSSLEDIAHTLRKFN